MVNTQHQERKKDGKLWGLMIRFQGKFKKGRYKGREGLHFQEGHIIGGGFRIHETLKERKKVRAK